MAASAAFGRAGKVVVFGGLVTGTFGLGCWQTSRYAWKVDLLESRRVALAAPPVALPPGASASSLAADAPALSGECRRVALRGKYDASRTARVGPRSAPPGLGQKAPGMGTNPQGYLIFGVLVRPDGTEVVVNRGWAPKTLVDADADAAAPPSEERDVIAIVDAGETPGSFTPVNTEKDVLWVEAKFLRRKLGVPDDALLLDACPSASPDGAWPRPRSPDHRATAAVMPITHAGYAGTWYALAAAGAVMSWYV